MGDGHDRLAGRGVPVGGQQAPPRQGQDHAVERRLVVDQPLEVRAPPPAPRRLARVGDRDEVQEEVVCDGAIVPVEGRPGILGPRGERAGHAARCDVGGTREPVAVTSSHSVRADVRALSVTTLCVGLKAAIEKVQTD